MAGGAARAGGLEVLTEMLHHHGIRILVFQISPILQP
jgi:hypothetical protein